MGRCVTNVNNAHRLEVYAVLALICGASATALNPVFVRLMDLDPSASAFHRMAWAFPLMWGWAFIENRSQTKKAAAGSDRWALALCGLFFAGDLLALHWAIELTAVANAILFLNAQPIYVALGAWLLFGERVNAGLGVGIAVGITGAGRWIGHRCGPVLRGLYFDREPFVLPPFECSYQCVDLCGCGANFAGGSAFSRPDCGPWHPERLDAYDSARRRVPSSGAGFYRLGLGASADEFLRCCPVVCARCGCIICLGIFKGAGLDNTVWGDGACVGVNLCSIPSFPAKRLSCGQLSPVGNCYR